jgi:hypothetical protein
MFPFRSESPFLNRWKISELLPEKVNQKLLRQKLAAVRRSLCKSQANLALRYNRNRVPTPFKLGDLVYYKNHPISHAGRHIAAILMPRYKGPLNRVVLNSCDG